MKSKINKKKYLLTLATPILFLPLINISCSQSSSIIELKNDLAMKKNDGINFINQEINQPNEKFINDIARYATDDSILFYNISLIAVAHKYIPLAHMLNVLQINPNKEIFFFVNTKNYNPNFNEIIASRKFPNLHLIQYQSNCANFDGGTFPYGYEAISAYKEAIRQNNLDKSKIVFNSDEYYFLHRLNAYINNNKISIEGFISDYLLFYDFREINMIADGSASAQFYSNNFFDYMLKNQQYFEFNNQNKTYVNATKFLQYFKTLNDEQKADFVRNNQYGLDITKILYYFVIGSKNVTSNDLVKVNFYVPSLQMIIDANNTSSTYLSHNDKYDLFFDPFNSYNMNFIELLKLLQGQQYIFFFKLIKINDQQINDINQYENQFNDFYNIVYSGTKIASSIYNLEQQAQVLITIYQENYAHRKKLKIWFKAHPRESDNYQKLLKDKIISLGYPEIANQIYFLNKSIPMEILISRSFMKSDPAKNRFVKFYSTFSTITFFIYANKQEDDLARIILKPTDLDFITPHFGNEEQSILFNKSKVILSNEFEQLYNFKTKISNNQNYLIFDKNNQTIIEWNKFEEYNKWPFFSRLNFKVTFTLNNKEFVFEHNKNEDKYNSGIILTNKKLLNEMMNSIVDFKDYNFDTYSLDQKATETMPYNINLLNENRKYTIANVKIQYLNEKNEWSLFSNILDFIILKDF